MIQYDLTTMIQYEFIYIYIHILMWFNQERRGSYQYEAGLAVYFPFFLGQAVLFSCLDSA